MSLEGGREGRGGEGEGRGVGGEGRRGRGGEGRGGEGGGEGRGGEGRGGEGSLRPMYFRKHELFRVNVRHYSLAFDFMLIRFIILGTLNNTFITIKTSFINYLPSNSVTLG